MAMINSLEQKTGLNNFCDHQEVITKQYLDKKQIFDI